VLEWIFKTFGKNGKPDAEMLERVQSGCPPVSVVLFVSKRIGKRLARGMGVSGPWDASEEQLEQLMASQLDIEVGVHVGVCS
jgi:hypothetical protein